VDLAGKHGRVRTVPMPTWTKVAIVGSKPCRRSVFRSVGRLDANGGLSSWPERADQNVDGRMRHEPRLFARNIIGKTGIEGLYITTGWGTWGFKAIPAGGEQDGGPTPSPQAKRLR
jgi:hypothetical protein